jgi:hypothetical protein
MDTVSSTINIAGFCREVVIKEFVVPIQFGVTPLRGDRPMLNEDP